MHDLIGALKIVGGQAERGESKGYKCGENALSIDGIRFHEKIEIPGETRCAVKRKRIPADNEVLNVAGVEQREQLSEVWLCFHNIGCVDSRRWRRVPRASCSASRLSHLAW